MLERMWKKGNSATVLVGMKVGVVTVENTGSSVNSFK